MDPKHSPLDLFQAASPGSWIAVGLLVAVACVFHADWLGHVCGLSALPALFFAAMAWCGAGLVTLLGLIALIWAVVRKKGDG